MVSIKRGALRDRTSDTQNTAVLEIFIQNELMSGVIMLIQKKT